MTSKFARLLLASATVLAFSASSLADHLKPPPYQNYRPVKARSFDRNCTENEYVEVETYDIYEPRDGNPDTFVYYFNGIMYVTMHLSSGQKRYENHYKEIYPFLIHVPNMNRYWLDQHRKGESFGSGARTDGKPVVTDPCKFLKELKFGHGPHIIRRRESR